MSKEKIIAPEKFTALRREFRQKNKKVVLCHGVFDLLHYGHIEHLQEAKSQGDILVVSVTSAPYVNKGPGRPYFTDEQRLSFLASIEFVDYVLLSEAVTVHKIVEIVQPDVYVKGQEYAAQENDITGNIGAEQEIVERYGGKIYFTQGEVYSSTKLLNNFFGALPEEALDTSRRMKKKYGATLSDDMRQAVESFADLNVLVVGDVIIDEYAFCLVQGVTMKDSAVSTRYDHTERYAGGSLAIARHIANFARNTTLLSMMGYDEKLENFIVKKMHNVTCRIVQDKYFRTPVKRRYLKENVIRKEYDKLFSVNFLSGEAETSQTDYGNFYRNLEELLPQFDLVVVCDYGHGLLDEKSIRMVEEKAKLLALNCQTNSSNFGLNPITKYKRADIFVVDDREVRLPFGQTRKKSDELLPELKTMLGSEYAWLTQGARGAFGIKGNEAAQIPAVTLHVKDTVGAGDAYFALTALAAAKQMPIDQATLIGNIAGAIKTNLVGNSKPVNKVDLLKFLSTVLNV